MKKIIILLFFAASQTIQASAQAKTNVEKTDSIVAVLPHLSGYERLIALQTLQNLSLGLPEQKQYAWMYLNEARRQKDVQAESAALVQLTMIYFPQFDSDSIFIIGEEAIRFARQHKQYADMFVVQSELIRRYKAQGQFLIALRKAEEAYAEAGELQDDMFMARMLSSIGEILYNLEQYEGAIKHWVECIGLAASCKYAPDELFILQHYDLLACAVASLNRSQEALSYADNMQAELDRLQRDAPDTNLQQYHFYMEYHRALAYSEMMQPERALEAIRRAEAVYNPQWNELNPSFALQIDNLYAYYYRAAGNYNKSLELFNRILRFDEDAHREAAVVMWKKEIAKIYREKGDYQAAADLYNEVLKKEEELNNEQFYAQIGELRILFELDKAERESERRLATLRGQRFVITGLSCACLTLALIAGLTVWSRKRIAEKNRSLYHQIKEQDSLVAKLEQMQLRCETANVETLPASSLQQPETGNTQQRMLVARLRDYLLKERKGANPETNIDEIIAALATNRSTFFESVKTVTDKSPADYIRNMQLEEAKKMLETRYELNVEVVAEACGFNSRATFYRLFRERYHISPAEYRKMAKLHTNGRND